MDAQVRRIYGHSPEVQNKVLKCRIDAPWIQGTDASTKIWR